jgi:nickel/cobalt transporter (NicO) family protein
MTSFADLIQTDSGWLFMPSAILLGALHGLEPGHSKGVMAAFIVATRGTVWQAALLALSATISHTAAVWLLALAALSLGPAWGVDASEPYFQIASAVVIIGIALWMLVRTVSAQRGAHAHHAHDHEHEHAPCKGHDAHDHTVAGRADLDALNETIEDPHARFHAEQIERQFSGQQVTNGQIALFGLTGGLLPCAAAVTVLLLCLQIKAFSLGIVLVLCFSIGLALTLFAAGAAAAWGARFVAKRVSGFDRWARRLPYLSSAVVVALGIYVGVQGLVALG